jgi:hypothetical protein
MKKKLLVMVLSLAFAFWKLSASANVFAPSSVLFPPASAASTSVSLSESSSVTAFNMLPFSLFSPASFGVAFKNPSSSRNSVNVVPYSTSMASLFWDLIFDGLSALWWINNIVLNFDSYPYAHGKYLIFPYSDSSAAPAFDDSVSSLYSGKFYRFALDTSFLCFPGENAGNITRFEGLIWKFFGPVVELYSEFPEEGEKQMNLRLGGQFALIQTNPASVFFNIQWSHDFFGGEGERNGLVLGFIVRSYPVKPVLLEWRGAWIIHNTVMFESHLELGGMVWGPVEIFAAWDFRGYYKRSGKSISESKNGFDVGLRYHF